MRRLFIMPLLLTGCQLASPSASSTTTPHLDMQFKNLHDSIVEVQNKVETSVKTVTNEVWPWMVSSSVATLFQTGLLFAVLYFAFRLMRRWIVEHSYLEQKPKWERQKNGH